MIKFLFVCILFFLLNNCTDKISYSGKIFDQKNLDNINYKNKENLTKNLGIPSYVDPINNKYFYFSEKSQKKSIFKKEVQYSYIFVFEFDSNNKIINSNVYDLKNKKSINLIENETSSDIVRRGLLERIFGGIGPQQTLGNTP